MSELQLHARREHFGVLLYSAEVGTYLHVSYDDANFLEHEIRSGATRSAALSSIGLHDNYESFRWISNTRAYPSALSAPLKIFFNLTKRCNLSCRHCYNESGKKGSPEMPASRVIEILDDLERLGVFRVTLAGGEPTFHREFLRILSAIGDSSLTVSMVTNGMALTEKLVDRLTAADRIRSVTVSIDGATPDGNDPVRGRGTFDRIVAGAERLRRGYPYDVHLRMTLTRPAIASLHAVPDLLATTGIDALKVNRCNPYGRAARRLDLVPTPNEYEDAWALLQALAERHGFTVEVPSRKYVVEPNGTSGLCRAGEETAEIDGDGTLYPCSFSWGRFSAGNLQTRSTDSAILALQEHSINNGFCMQCRGRGGAALKSVGYVTRLPRIAVSRAFDSPPAYTTEEL